MTRIQFHDWILFFEKKREMPIHCLLLSNICTHAFSKFLKNTLTLECLLLHICLSLPALQRTLIHSSFKPLKPFLLNRYMSVPWKVWISEPRWKYKQMLLKNILILLNCYSSRQDLANEKTKLSWKTCFLVDERSKNLSWGIKLRISLVVNSLEAFISSVA